MLGPTSHLAGAAAEQLQSLPVPRDERLLFGTRPALELSFTGQSFFPTLAPLAEPRAAPRPSAVTLNRSSNAVSTNGIRAERTTLPEQVVFRITHQLARRPLAAGISVTAHDSHRHAVELALHQLGGGRYLVRDGERADA